MTEEHPYPRHVFVSWRLIDVGSLSGDPLDWMANAEPFPLMHVLTTQYYAVKLYGLSKVMR